MNRGSSSGFTIIEVMLFLAISGLMMAVVLASAAAPINRQRYRDSANSFVSFLQGQYDRTVNVQNDRDEKLKCTLEAGIADVGGVNGRGTSDCTIIGRYISSTNGLDLVSRAVYSTKQIDNSITNDTTSLLNSGLIVSDLGDTMNYKMEWETSLVGKSDANVLPLHILILRSPSSGTIRTYVRTGSNGSISEIIQGSASKPSRVSIDLCIDEKGLTDRSLRTGATLVKDASNSSGVKKMVDGQCG